MGKVLFISKNGDAYGLATKLAEEGHEVKIYLKEEEARNTGKGYKNPLTVSQWHPHVSSSELIIFDMVGLGKLADTLRKQGKNVLGSSEFGDTLELERDLGSKIMGKHSEAVIPETATFSEIEKGIKYIESKDYPCVFKPLGNEMTSWTFVAKEDNKGLISFMRSINKKVDFIIQQKIDGVEISTEGWFNGKIFSAFNHTIEKKRFMEGDKGPNTGCMGNIVWKASKDKLVQTLLCPLVPVLEGKYVGPVDVNVIVNKDGAHFLELTVRFGYDALQAWLTKTDKKFEFLMGIASRSHDEHAFDNKIAAAVRLSMSPFPSPHEKGLKGLEGLRVLDVPAYLKKNVWLSDVMNGEEDLPVMAGVDGVVGCVTALGDTIDKAMGSVYTMIDVIKLNNDLQYRSDIGEGVEESIEELRKGGWL